MKTLRIPFTILCVLAISALSANAAQLATAKVLEVMGTVTKYAANGGKGPLKAGDILTQGDEISASALSSAKLVFSNGSELTIEENTSVDITKLEQASFSSSQSYEQLQADPSKSQTLLNLNYGKLNGHVKKLQSGSTFMVETQLGTAAIRGTQFSVELRYNATRGEFELTVNNFDGLVDIISQFGGKIDFSGKQAVDVGYDNNSGQETSPIPAQRKITIRISRGDPAFDALFSLVKNYIPTEQTPGWIQLPAPEITPEDPGVTIVSPEDQNVAID
ncbi:FecR domain-containing protein [Coraliomargarita sp. SDUM461004]|uniref:FecR domain-containing protein n=1 Tax=Thalassobacterium sedimentorum TaxID=3041258 RepID=A0ABU1AIN3_9BACT|nr:FecR domain-containing protein [Coraliomargarita sp. SDUM461004]MDQ8194028.1 FecR domain-containing protein [Coraliomargarita sp. SDUM461004]